MPRVEILPILRDIKVGGFWAGFVQVLCNGSPTTLRCGTPTRHLLLRHACANIVGDTIHCFWYMLADCA
jgi:hypothetical protein